MEHIRPVLLHLESKGRESVFEERKEMKWLEACSHVYNNPLFLNQNTLLVVELWGIPCSDLAISPQRRIITIAYDCQAELQW